MPPLADLENLKHALKKRGFHQDDMLMHECPACNERAVAIWAIGGRTGGRDIRLCYACGDARSWRAAPGLEAREPDPSFDLRAFLK